MGSCCTLRSEAEFMDDTRESYLGLKKTESVSGISSVETYVKNKDKKGFKVNDISVVVCK